MDKIVGFILTVIPLISLLQLRGTHAKNILYNGGLNAWKPAQSEPSEQAKISASPKQSSPELIPQLSTWPWEDCFTLLPQFLTL